MLKIIREYRKWHKKWDDLCDRCGLCCYTRSVSLKGEIVVDYNSPCEYLDKETRLCRVFKNRFKFSDYCGSVNIFCALFNRSLPPSCAYARTFRFWKKKDSYR